MTSTRQIVDQFVTAFKGDFKDALLVLSDNYHWWTVGFGDSTGIIFEIRAAMDPHVEGKIDVEVIDIIVEGNRAAVEFEGRARLKNGTYYHNKYHLKLIVENEKIVKVIEYFDSAHAKAIWGAVLGDMLQ